MLKKSTPESFKKVNEKVTFQMSGHIRKRKLVSCFIFLYDLMEKEMATHSGILGWRNPVDRGAWEATVYGVAQSRT